MTSKSKPIVDTPRYDGASVSRLTLTSAIARAPTSIIPSTTTTTKPSNSKSKTKSSKNKTSQSDSETEDDPSSTIDQNIIDSNSTSESERMRSTSIKALDDSGNEIDNSSNNNTSSFESERKRPNSLKALNDDSSKDVDNNNSNNNSSNTNPINYSRLQTMVFDDASKFPMLSQSVTHKQISKSNSHSPGYNNNINNDDNTLIQDENYYLKERLAYMENALAKLTKQTELQQEQNYKLIETMNNIHHINNLKSKLENETVKDIKNYDISDINDDDDESKYDNDDDKLTVITKPSKTHSKVKHEPHKHNTISDTIEQEVHENTVSDVEETDDPNRKWEVKSIVGERWKNNVHQYRVRWKHFDKSHDSWRSVKHLTDCPDAISEWKYKQRQIEMKRVKEEEPYVPMSKYTKQELNSTQKLVSSNIKSDSNSKSEIKTQNIKADNKNCNGPPGDDDPSDDDDSDSSDNEASVSKEVDNPFQYLVPFLILRERLYPFSSNQQLYTGRFSLLDMDWRMSEVYRFGFLVDFDPALYASIFRRYYDILRIKRGLEPKWFKNIRTTSVNEKSLPELAVTYSPADMAARGGSFKQDFNLTDKSTTYIELPIHLRKHPSSWSMTKSMYDNPPTFSELANKRLNEEAYDISMKHQDGLRKLTADRARVIHGEKIPNLELDNITPEINSIGNVKQEFIKRELKRDDSTSQYVAEQNYMFKHILSEVSMEIRSAVILELTKKKFTGSDNRFADKTLLKKPPTPKELFTGKDLTYAATILHYLLVNIAKYDFNVSESFSFIESALSEDALIWFNNLYADIFNQQPQDQLYRFVQLFKEQYMNQSMAMIYEKQVKYCKLQQETPRAVDTHFNLFMKLVSSWRACDYTVLDSKLVHIYFSNLPIETQRTVGVSAVKTCKTASDLYNIVKETATMISKTQPRTYDRDIISANSMQLYNNNNQRYNSRNRHNNNYHDNNESHTNFNSYNHIETEFDSDYSDDNNNYDNNNNHIDIYSDEIFDDTKYTYVYPTIEEYCNSMTYNDNIDAIYFNASYIQKDQYTRDWKCFHCGEVGHRAGWFCPYVREGKDQTPRGAFAYAEYQKKYAKEIKPYDLKQIIKAEVTYWQQKGKDVKTVVEEKLRGKPSNNQFRKNNNNKYVPKTFTRPQRPQNNSQPKQQMNMLERIKANQDRLKNRAREITDVNEDSDQDEEVQVIPQNSLITYIDSENTEVVGNIEVPEYTIYLNSITNNISMNNDNSQELEIIHKLIHTEKQYAHPLLVQVELNNIRQNVLLDQGATRNICRKTVLDTYYPDIYHELLPSKCAVVSSSGTMIPIYSRVKITVRVSETEYQDAVFYVVSNTPTLDIISSFVLGRTFLSISGLCYDNKHDILFDKNNTNKVYMKVLNGKIVSSKREHSNSDIIPLCAIMSCDNIDNNINVNTYQYQTNRTKIKVNKKVTTTDKKVPIYNKNEILNNNNNKKKDNNHKMKLKHRQDKNKQRDTNKQLKQDKIISTFKQQLDNKNYTKEMKEVLLNHIQININKYDIVDVSDKTATLLARFNNNNVTDKDIIKKEQDARTKSYMQAYEQTNNSKESDLIMDQLLQILNEKDTDSEDDEIMKKINDIEELAPPSKQADTTEMRQQKVDKVNEMINNMTNINSNEKLQLINKICKYIDVYSLNGENFQQTDIVEHDINLEPDTKPFHQRLRVYSPALQKIIDTEVNKMIQDNIIVTSTSPYASNLLLVRKPDPFSPGGIKNRVCVNFIQLNKLTIKDRYPLPNQQDIFRQIGSAKYFTTMDLMSGFWQIAIKPEHRHKTAFITTRGLYEFLVMPFGLCNAPSTFQRMMDRIIKTEYRSFIQTYIDDIILYSKSFNEHISHIDILHKILRENKLTVKLSKCHFSQNSVKFLGHVLSEGIIKPNPEKIESIQKWQLPKDASAVRSFLGAVGWYRKFIPKFAEVAIPLINLTKKNAIFNFDIECQKSFEILRQALISEPVLRQADNNKDYYVDTDASGKALSIMLSQEDENGDKHPVAYASKTLNSAQLNYSTSEKECLALVWGLEHFNTYLEGHSFTCLTDHRALIYLIGSKESNNQRLTRWILRLQPYNLKIKYVKGSDNNMADLLSRPDLMTKAYLNNYTVKNDYVYFHGADINVRRSKRDRVPTANFYAPEEPIFNYRTDDGTEYKKVSKVSNNKVSNSTSKDIDNSDINNENININDENNNGNNEYNMDISYDMGERKVKKKVTRIKRKRGTRAEKQLQSLDVECILDKRKIHPNTNECEYLVKWKHYDDTHNSWENLHQLRGCINLVLDYERTIKKIVNINNNNKNEYACSDCTETFKLAHKYYIHCYKEHGMPIPKLDSELGIIDEIDDVELFDMQTHDSSIEFIYRSNLGDDMSYVTNNRERKDLSNHEFFLNNKSVLYTADSNKNGETIIKLVLPKPLRIKLISEIHDGVMSAHPGIAHTCKRISEVAWWPYWRSDVIRYILSCEKCQRAKRKKSLNQLPRPVSVSSRPFQHIGVDVVGPFPTSQRGNVYILTIVDHFTRWAEAIPMAEQTSKCIAQNIIKHVICRHGLFDIMTTDNGSVFVSEIANYVYKELGIKRRRTTPHHPQSNGIPERFHDTMKTMLKIWCNEEQDNWDEYLPYVLFAYNTSYHTLLQETPFFLVNGRDPKLLSDIIVNKSEDEYSDVHVYGDELVNKLKTVYNRIKEIYTNINSERLLALDNVQEKQFNIGDKVLIYDPTTQVGLSRKLTIRWKGPYVIIEKRSDINYVINIDGKMSLVNRHRLRAFNDKNIDETTLYTTEQALLTEDVERLSKLELELRSQKEYKELQLQIAIANQAVVNNNNNNNNNDNNININNGAIDNHALPLVQNEDDEESDIRFNSFMVTMQF